MKSKIYRGKYFVDPSGNKRWQLENLESGEVWFPYAKRGYDEEGTYKVFVKNNKVVKTRKMKFNQNRYRRILKKVSEEMKQFKNWDKI